MNTYRFTTTTTMKEYNREKWWIDSGVVRPAEIDAESVTEALALWRELVQDNSCIEISNNAIKTAQPMFRYLPEGGAKQIGYVITGKTDFERGRGQGWSAQYIDLWTTIQIVTTPDFAAK